MKRTLALLLTFVLLFTLTACGQGTTAPAADAATADPGAGAATGETSAPAEASAWKFERRVEIMVPASEGGGLDTTIRAFAPILQKYIGQSIVVNNRAGGSGIVGYTWSHNSTNDGYAFQFTAPSAILANAQGMCEFDLMDGLIPVSGLVQAEGILFSSKKAPFTTAEELIEYAKANPGKVTLSSDSPKGIVGALTKEFCDQAGIELNIVASDSNEANIALISGEVQLYIGTWSDMGAYVDSGDVNALLMLTEERSSLFPDIPCFGELGFTAKLGFYRVFTALQPTPQEAVDAFAAAVRAASQDEEWLSWLKANGMTNDYVFTAAELQEVLDLSTAFGKELAG